MTIKVLNLYAGIGGNRQLWKDVDVTAVEIELKIAKIYSDFFPNDKVIVADAHQFLLDHFKEFDFIWSSPPCPSHSRFNVLQAGHNQFRFPDMKLYEEIIFLKHWYSGKWVVENVISYYDPLIKPVIIDGHYFWANFILPENNKPRNEGIQKGNIEDKAKKRNIALNSISELDREKVLNNMVIPETGLRIFNLAFAQQQKSLAELLLQK